MEGDWDAEIILWKQRCDWQDRMIEELRFNKPAIRYFFGTEKAINYLQKI